MSDRNDMWRATVARWENMNNDEIVTETDDLFDALSPSNITPAGIVAKLDEYVIGQVDAKKTLAVSVYNRLLALNNARKKQELPFEKHNLLFIGGTGCGKTHLIRSLSKALSIPISVQDATTFTSAGYVGRDVDESLKDLMRSAKTIVDENPEYKWVTQTDKLHAIQTLGEHGLVFIDEIDKIRATGGPGKDVNGKAVQEALLKLVEGKKEKVMVDGYSYNIDTSKILFVISGAFSDMPSIINHRTAKTGIGFGAEVSANDTKAVLKDTTIADLTTYGIIPELIGRFPGLAVLDDLTKESLTQIFIQPADSVLKQITNEFKSFGVSVGFEKAAIQHIVEISHLLNIGARSLRSTAYRLLQPVLFAAASNPPSKPIVITKALLEKANGK